MLDKVRFINVSRVAVCRLEHMRRIIRSLNTLSHQLCTMYLFKYAVRTLMKSNRRESRSMKEKMRGGRKVAIYLMILVPYHSLFLLTVQTPKKASYKDT